LCKRGELRPGSELYGKAFENWVFHELSAHNAYTEIEVDFIVNDMQVAIDAKATSEVTADHIKELRALAQDHPRVKERLLVCLEAKSRRTEEGILVVPALEFCALLKSGELF
jgi:predicted AAA+ superfamily ATPase